MIEIESKRWKYYIVDLNSNFTNKDGIENWTLICKNKIIGIVIEAYVDGTFKIIGDPDVWEIEYKKYVMEVI